MKSNKEKVYDFIKLHAGNEERRGVATAYIAEVINMQRTNVSTILNQLVEEGRIDKTNGRPVLYYVAQSGHEGKDACFAELIGADGSLKHAVQLAKAAVLYPEQSLNSVLTGERGTGKRRLARLMYRFAIAQGVLPENAPYVQVDCHDYIEDSRRVEKELFGSPDESGYIEEASGGVLYFDNIQYLPRYIRKQISKRINDLRKNSMVIVSCIEKRQLEEDEFFSDFPIIIQLPTLSERPLEERMEMLQRLLSLEAARVKRTLVVKEDLMRCLLLYECEANYHQLKGDIKIGCANAYVREYKNQDEMQLFISDFEHHIRKGFLRYRLYKNEIDALVPADYTYTFDGKTVNISEAASNNIYEQISRGASALNANGLDEDEINLILRAEVERSFQKYQKELLGDVTNKEQLSVLVDTTIINLVEAFLQRASEKLDRNFSASVFYGLCLHIKTAVNRKEQVKKINKNQITDILSNYKKEYLLSAELAEEIGKAYHIELPMDEIILITMFICYQGAAANQVKKPVVLFAFYGEGVATAIAKTIAAFTQLENVFAFELSYEKDAEETYVALKTYIESIHQGKGIFVVYDSSFLPDMLCGIEEELKIFIRPFPAPIITMGIELARKAATDSNPDRVYLEALKDISHLTGCGKNYIVTLCTTGKGGAEELKAYIERYGQLQDEEVIPLAVSNPEALQESFKKLMKTGVISCVVGTFNPKLFSIPFLSISEVFGAAKENLPKLLRMEKTEKSEINYSEIFEYLEKQLEHVNVTKLKKLLTEVLRAINEQIKELSLDTEVGLLMHMACCIERLLGEGVPTANPRKKAILSQYETQFNRLLKIVKPIEKGFRIILNDDEMANILMIIYQI